MLLQVENITKKYGKQYALDSVNFCIDSNQVVGLLGPNGAGKSTLMKIITTYLQPDVGNVEVCGFSSEKNPVKVKAQIGYLPENNPLYLDMYVREYLRFTCGMYRDMKNITSAVEKIIETTMLTSEANKKIGQLSKGYRQRVGLAAALIHQPKVLILDEPTSGLDPNQLIEIRALIKALGKDKIVIISTHILQEVEAMCSRIILLNKGRIMLDKNIDEIDNLAQTFQDNTK